MLRNIAVVLAAVLATLLAAELALRALPVSTATMTGYHFDSDLLTYPARHEWTASTGWDLRNSQTLHSNNWGFASIDFVPGSGALGLIGDSYVEASMLSPGDRPAEQLQRLLGESRPVYGLGSPGTALLDFAQRIRFADQQFGVRDFVVWADAGDVRQAVCGSGNVHSRCLDAESLLPRIERLPSPGAAKQLARHSALAQYFFSQLKLDLAQLPAALLRRNVPAEEVSTPQPAVVASDPAASEASRQRSRQLTDAVLTEFFKVAGPHVRGRLIFLIDGRRVAIPRPSAEADFERQYLMDRLRALGVEVVDAELAYAAHAGRSDLSIEVGPYDRHLNALGVQLAMGVAAAQVRQSPQQP